MHPFALKHAGLVCAGMQVRCCYMPHRARFAAFTSKLFAWCKLRSSLQTASLATVGSTANRTAQLLGEDVSTCQDNCLIITQRTSCSHTDMLCHLSHKGQAVQCALIYAAHLVVYKQA